MKKFSLLFLVVLGLMAFAMPAQSLTFYYNYEYSGGTAPEGAAPWLTADFADVTDVYVPEEGMDMSGVQLTLSTAGLIGSEFVSSWYFNVNPALDPYDAIEDIYHLSGVVPYSATWGDDAVNAAGGQSFDFLLEFDTAKAYRFTGGQTSVLLFTGPGLTADDFNYLSAMTPGGGGIGPFLSVARVQVIGTSAEESGWVAPVSPVSEPVTIILLGLGLVGVAGISMRLRK